MSDYAVNLLKAIESGDQESMNTAFNDAIGAKIGDALDAKKIEVAKSIYGGEVEQEASDETVETSDDSETNLDTSAEDGTEEV